MIDLRNPTSNYQIVNETEYTYKSSLGRKNPSMIYRGKHLSFSLPLAQFKLLRREVYIDLCRRQVCHIVAIKLSDSKVIENLLEYSRGRIIRLSMSSNK